MHICAKDKGAHINGPFGPYISTMVVNIAQHA